MKNSKINYLILVCCILVFFTLGFFLGRNVNHAQIQVDSAFQNNADQNTQPSQPDRININIASAEQLQTLPQIGPVLAQRICDYRTEHGNFSSVGDLLEVNGIGQKTLEAILDYITIGG